MDYVDIQPLLNVYHRKIATVDLRFKRYLYNRINWNVRMIGVKGARGVGKTTMLLQHIKENFTNLDEALYVSLDNLWFETHTLEDLVEFLYTHGVTHIYLDEVHRYGNWLTLLKNLYDNYPDLNIVYTGSAMLAIDKSVADLSRRQSLYTLNGLSFREYLEYEGVISLPALDLSELLSTHTNYALRVASQIKVLKHFERYLQIGYYPFFKEANEDYYLRLNEVVRLIIESDIPAEEDIKYATTQKIKKLLMVIAENVPLEANINKMAAQLESTRDQTLKMLYLLDKAGLLWILTDQVKDYKHLTGPKKLYLNNT
ncbi:MAG: AAA family ATPase, partial [Muribaculaceae bacterium]|nr:AAA family ATPase [Muribaculaceae bacterium]